MAGPASYGVLGTGTLGGGQRQAAEVAGGPELRAKSPISSALDDLSHHITQVQMEVAQLRDRLNPVLGCVPNQANPQDPEPKPNPDSVLSLIDFAAYRLVRLESEITDLRARLQV